MEAPSIYNTWIGHTGNSDSFAPLGWNLLSFFLFYQICFHTFFFFLPLTGNQDQSLVFLESPPLHDIAERTAEALPQVGETLEKLEGFHFVLEFKVIESDLGSHIHK